MPSYETSEDHAQKETTGYREQDEKKVAAYQAEIRAYPKEKIVYADGCEIDTYLYREYGYAARGQKVFSWISGLKWEDFDSKAGTLKICRTIRTGKGSKLESGNTKTYARKRNILLPNSTAQLIRERRKSALTEWIFSDLINPEKPTRSAGAYR